jgi:hypothetical protein
MDFGGEPWIHVNVPLRGSWHTKNAMVLGFWWSASVLPDGLFSNQKIPVWVNFGKSWKMLVFLWPFYLHILRIDNILYGDLVHFLVIRYYFCLGIFPPEKSGNSGWRWSTVGTKLKLCLPRSLKTTWGLFRSKFCQCLQTRHISRLHFGSTPNAQLSGMT